MAAVVVAVVVAATEVVMATKMVLKVKVQKAPKAGMFRTPILIPPLVSKPIKAGYPISSAIKLTGINRPSTLLYCHEYLLISPTYVN